MSAQKRGVLGKSAVDRFTTEVPIADALRFFLQIVRRKQTAKAVLTLLKEKSLPSRRCHPPVLLYDWAYHSPTSFEDSVLKLCTRSPQKN